MKAMRGILGLIRQADQKFDLFHEKDRIAVGVSGGKDSMVLALALNQYKKFKCVNFEIVPIILDLGFDGFESKEIEKFFEANGMKLNVINSKDVYPILKANMKDEHLPCSICSRMKKAAINKAAKDLGCNKVAFAHHADDAIETLLMNAIFGGRVATFQPKMKLERADIEFIRPLILVHESQIKTAQKEENIPSFSSHCPNDGYTMRAEMKEIVQKLYKKYPSSKDNFLLMLENYSKEVLFHNDINYKIERKNLSFRPVITANDAIIDCELRAKLGLTNFDKDLYRFIIYSLDKPIGVLSIRRIDDLSFEIIDLKTLRYSKVRYETLYHFVESNITRWVYGAKINVKTTEFKDYLKTIGYKKVRKCGLVKQF